eukprot:GHVU01111765.1.p1 GENE.GHVU01111765.1~~GHVU01111765.1.p1  ORF type:complete len:189 (-),score=21.03 GHVU01111765.1:1794-2360(-)
MYVFVRAGVKATKHAWLDGPQGTPYHVLTTGFSKSASREVKLWDLRMTAKEQEVKEIDRGAGSLFPFVDPSTGLILLTGKGDPTIRMWLFEKAMKIAPLTEFKLQEDHKFFGVAPKRAMNINASEVMRVYRTEGVTTIRPLSIALARVKHTYSPQIYPPCYLGKPRMVGGAPSSNGSLRASPAPAIAC